MSHDLALAWNAIHFELMQWSLVLLYLGESFAHGRIHCKLMDVPTDPLERPHGFILSLLYEPPLNQHVGCLLSVFLCWWSRLGIWTSLCWVTQPWAELPKVQFYLRVDTTSLELLNKWGGFGPSLGALNIGLVLLANGYVAWAPFVSICSLAQFTIF